MKTAGKTTKQIAKALRKTFTKHKVQTWGQHMKDGAKQFGRENRGQLRKAVKFVKKNNIDRKLLNTGIKVGGAVAGAAANTFGGPAAGVAVQEAQNYAYKEANSKKGRKRLGSKLRQVANQGSRMGASAANNFMGSS